MQGFSLVSSMRFLYASGGFLPLCRLLVVRLRLDLPDQRLISGQKPGIHAVAVRAIPAVFHGRVGPFAVTAERNGRQRLKFQLTIL